MTTSVRPAEPYAPPAAAPAPAAFDPTAFDPHDRAFQANPYPTYAAFRAGAPVALVQPYGSWWVFRHTDVLAALQDTDTFRKSIPGQARPTGTVVDALGAFPPGVFSADPPYHTQMRGAIEPPFRAALANAGAVAGGIADGLIDGIRRGGSRRMELMADYALRVPSDTLFALLGLPAAHGDSLRAMVSAIVAANDPTQSVGVRMMGATAVMALETYFQGMLVEMAAAPDATLCGRMLAAATAAGLTPLHVQTTLVNFVVAGYLSTTFLVGTGILNLLDPANAGQRAMLAARPERIGAAVNEMLRHDAPAQVVDRVVAADTTLGGVALPRGTHVTLVIGSANRDEAVFASPDAFDMDRTDARSAIPFGAGIHHCIGAPLVGIVAPLAIGRLLAAFPDLALDGMVQWQTDPYLRAPANVPLVVG